MKSVPYSIWISVVSSLAVFKWALNSRFGVRIYCSSHSSLQKKIWKGRLSSWYVIWSVELTELLNDWVLLQRIWHFWMKITGGCIHCYYSVYITEEFQSLLHILNFPTFNLLLWGPRTDQLYPQPPTIHHLGKLMKIQWPPTCTISVKSTKFHPRQKPSEIQWKPSDQRIRAHVQFSKEVFDLDMYVWSRNQISKIDQI